MMNKILRSVGLLTLAFLINEAGAQTFINPAFSGSTSHDGWEGLHNTTYPGYGGYPGSNAWPAPIESNTAGSGDVSLNKTGGSGYLSTTPGQYYIYSTLSGAQAANTSPNNVVGTFTLTDNNPVAGVETVLFQLQVSFWTNVGTPFPTGVLPTLNYNGGSQNIAATYSKLLYQGAFENDYGSGVADTWGFQWDLNSILVPITSYSITYSVTNHAQVYGLRLDSSDQMTQVVPEPSTYALMVLGLGALAFFHCRRKEAALARN